MAHRRWGRKRPALGKGALTGAMAGLAGAWAMNDFLALLSQATQKQQDNGARATTVKQPEPTSSDEEGDATQRIAARIIHAAFGRNLTRQQKNVAGPIVHYAVGCASGALYGTATELSPRFSKGFGLPLGAVLWLAADEIAVPALGLSRPALDYPLSSHLSALGAHTVYGFTTELARRVLRIALST